MRQQPSILVVDDEPNVALTLRMIFEAAGFRATSAASARDALRLFDGGRHFDVVLTDLNMEREDIGLEVARVAKRLRPKPVVVILTGYASMKNAQTALEIQVDHFANKPVEIPKLIETVQRLVGWRRDAMAVGE